MYFLGTMAFNPLKFLLLGLYKYQKIFTNKVIRIAFCEKGDCTNLLNKQTNITVMYHIYHFTVISPIFYFTGKRLSSCHGLLLDSFLSPFLSDSTLFSFLSLNSLFMTLVCWLEKTLLSEVWIEDSWKTLEIRLKATNSHSIVCCPFQI